MSRLRGFTIRRVARNPVVLLLLVVALLFNTGAFAMARTPMETYTACLATTADNSGQLFNVSIGDRPSDPCPYNSTQVSYNQPSTGSATGRASTITNLPPSSPSDSKGPSGP